MKKTAYSKYLLLLSLLATGSSSMASNMYVSNVLVTRVNNSSGYLVNKVHVEQFGYSWTAFWTAYQNVITRINSVPANYTLTAIQMADTDFSFRNGNNKDEVYFSYGVQAGVAAVTLNDITLTRDIFGKVTKAVIKEADVTLSTAGRFAFGETTAYQLNEPGNKDPFEEVFMHELGHGMALDHTSAFRHNMGLVGCGLYANGDIARSYVGGGYTSELQIAYGTWTGGLPDYMVSAYNRVDSQPSTISGQKDYALCSYNTKADAPNVDMFSNLTFNQGYVRNGAKKAWAMYVIQNDRVKLTFTFEATKLVASIPYKVYFSTNNVISSTDTVIASGTISNLGKAPFVYSIEVNVPYTSWRGFAAMGVILDPDNTLSEWSKNNNAAYWPVYVQY